MYINSLYTSIHTNTQKSITELTSYIYHIMKKIHLYLRYSYYKIKIIVKMKSYEFIGAYSSRVKFI